MKRFVLGCCLFLLMIGGTVSAQDGPETITIAGTIQSLVGCPGDWQPECDATSMTFDEGSGVWQASYELPVGSYEVKVAYNGTWDENYGLNGEPGGADIPFEVAEDDTTVYFTYSTEDHILNIEANGVALVGTVQQQAEEPTSSATNNPDMVNIPGTIQPALGCPGEWAPDCEATLLTYDEVGDVWIRSFEVPAGDYEYKVALNGNWTVNYGGNADLNGPNIVLSVPEDQTITFIYDHKTNLIIDSVRSIIATVPGSYQSEIGCSEDWQADCLRSLLSDVDGDGQYTFSASSIPAGDYEAKVAVNLSWDENYGEGGAADGANIPFTVENDGDTVTFVYTPEDHILNIVTGGNANISASDLTRSRAHWVTADSLLWDSAPEENDTYHILHSMDASIRVDIMGLVGDYEVFDLSINESGLADDVLGKFPHLAAYTALSLSADDVARVPELVRGQNYLIRSNADGEIQAVTGIQLPGVLDDLFTYDGDLGVIIEEGVPSLRVWAPTAQDVNLILIQDGEENTLDMERSDSGVWSITGEADWLNSYYLYEVTVYAPSERAIVVNEVTDPYSISLSVNSIRSQIVDLHDSQWMPDGWLDLEKPELNNPEDISLYELHIRDFSIFDTTVPEEYRGTYMAFTVPESNGMQHLSALAQAGLTHIHLLPTFDLATIIEVKARQFTPDYDLLATFAPDSEEQQAELEQFRDLDGFNWGYDPFHYNTPEGSYATDPDSPQRLLEFREMVKALNESGLRVVMDVVYNHTNSSGQSRRSVLDRVVPGYYHRLDANGIVTRSTCCENTATEHTMMRKLMIDSVLLYSTAYKIDGYRFDLMGHHMLADMVALRSVLDALTLDEDGVDGAKIYVYGEGWDFGEVASNARGINATQLNIGGTGIGVFNDRLRDAARGGNPFGGWQEQGFINGLFTNPNGLTPGDEAQQKARLLHFADQIRVGLAGNLADYEFTGASGETVTGADIDYNGSPAGYTQDPQENINYVSAHDNETLWDAITFKAPADTTLEERVRMQNMGLSLVGLSQGVPFFHAGSDMLRSKSMDRNSYNSGDWFNLLDFSYQTNNFGVGLPPAGDNRDNWPIMQPLLAREDLKPTSEHIMMSVNHLREIMQIRKSSPLFRLETGDLVQERLSFLNTGPDQIPGVIMMMLSDTAGDDLDPNNAIILVVFNASTAEISFTSDSAMVFELHPVQVNSADAVVQGASFEDGTFTVPAMTTAVFVAPQS